MQERSVAGYPSIIEYQPQTINLDLRQFHQRRANYRLIDATQDYTRNCPFL